MDDKPIHGGEPLPDDAPTTMMDDATRLLNPSTSSGDEAETAPPAAEPTPTADHTPTTEPVEATDTPDPMSDTLHPAMATSEPEGEPADRPTATVSAGDVYAGRYRLEQQLAQRGGTLTWRAFDQKLSRSVLVHVLAAGDPRTPDVLDAARKAAFATDSRFLRVLDAVVGENPGEPSLVVCEFAPGESVEKLLRQGPLSALEAAWVARELADAMQSMHAEGLFHQRINPDTVIITATGNVKIVGFLIEAAMYPDADEGTLAWSEREAADVMAIGKVLYASLVTRWPTAREQLLGDDGEPRRSWGLPAAPVDGRGWLTPRQVRSGVSPALDIICDQILSDAPRHNEMPLRTANQITHALSKVLGTADGAADLERRMRYPVVPAEDSEAVWETTGQMAVQDPMTSTDPFTPVPRPDGQASHGQRSHGATTATPAHAVAAASPATPSAPPPRPRPRAAAARSSRPPRRRWLTILVALVALVLLISLIRVAMHKDDSGGGLLGGDEAGQVLQVASVADFDPEGDGGNGQENPDQAKLATDGNPATAWTSVVYLNDAKLGKLKPGVGLVVDLGERKKVGTVKLTLKGSPTAVQLRVPKDSATDKAPTGSQKDWTTVASLPSAGTSVELKPEQSVESRYLLVYVTSLPKVSGNKYQAGIAEIEVQS